jgi:hypothetical protein
VKTAPERPRSWSLPSVLGLVTASIACLCAGALLAVSADGLPRVLFAGGGFSGYLFFFAHALRALGVPSTISGYEPDGEFRRDPAPQPASGLTDREPLLTIAA